MKGTMCQAEGTVCRGLAEMQAPCGAAWEPGEGSSCW